MPIRLDDIDGLMSTNDRRGDVVVILVPHGIVDQLNPRVLDENDELALAKVRELKKRFDSGEQLFDPRRGQVVGPGDMDAVMMPSTSNGVIALGKRLAESLKVLVVGDDHETFNRRAERQ